MLLCARRQVGGLLLVARSTLIALALLPIVGHLQAGGTMPAASAAALATGLQVSLTPVVASRPDATRRSLPDDGSAERTAVDRMDSGANRVCLYPQRDEAARWLDGQQCFDNLAAQLGGACDVVDSVAASSEAFCALLPPEAFGIPAAASAQVTAPPIAVAKSRVRPDSKYILHSSAAELMTYGEHYVLVCERNDGAGGVTLINDKAHRKLLADGFWEKYPAGGGVGCYTGANKNKPDEARMKTVLTTMGFAFLLGEEHGGLGLYTLLQEATTEQAAKKLPGTAEIWAAVNRIAPAKVTANGATRAAMATVDDKLFRVAGFGRPMFGQVQGGGGGEDDQEEEAPGSPGPAALDVGGVVDFIAGAEDLEDDDLKKIYAA
eukprot:COSAG06_NODE_11775_length_1466_cov_21.846379_1_plen_377_part_01